MEGVCYGAQRGDHGRFLLRRMMPKHCRLPSITATSPTSIAKIPEKIKKLSIVGLSRHYSQLFSEMLHSRNQNCHQRQATVLISPRGKSCAINTVSSVDRHDAMSRTTLNCTDDDGYGHGRDREDRRADPTGQEVFPRQIFPSRFWLSRNWVFPEMFLPSVTVLTIVAGAVCVELFFDNRMDDRREGGAVPSGRGAAWRK
jgi:hypothetical protein